MSGPKKAGRSRRLHVYEEVKRILSIILRDANVRYADLLAFRQATSQADFLFGAEISTYLNEIWQRGVKLEYWNKSYCDYTQPVPKGYDHTRVVDGMYNEMEWFSGQFDHVLELFKPYLHVGKRS